MSRTPEQVTACEWCAQSLEETRSPNIRELCADCAGDN